MFGLGAGEILVISVIALIFIGPKKLPEIAKGLGKGIREFQRAKNDLMDEVDKESIAQEVKETVAQAKNTNDGPHYIQSSAKDSDSIDSLAESDKESDKDSSITS